MTPNDDVPTDSKGFKVLGATCPADGELTIPGFDGLKLAACVSDGISLATDIVDVDFV